MNPSRAHGDKAVARLLSVLTVAAVALGSYVVYVVVHAGWSITGAVHADASTRWRVVATAAALEIPVLLVGAACWALARTLRAQALLALRLTSLELGLEERRQPGPLPPRHADGYPGGLAPHVAPGEGRPEFDPPAVGSLGS